MSINSFKTAKTEAFAAGYWGKMPAQDGFSSEGLPREFVEPWQEWLQLALERSRQQLSSSWLDTYLTSPVWYFTLASALCGENPWAGILMPSVDAKGGYFPLTIATPLAPGTNLVGILARAMPWFERAETLARTCLEEPFCLEEFERDVRLLSSPDSSGHDVSRRNADRSSLINAWRFGLSGPEALQHNCPAMLQQLLDQLLFSYSFWWSTGSEHIAPTWLVCQGLPPPEGFAAMLDGGWERWGWQDAEPSQPPPPRGER